MCLASKHGSICSDQRAKIMIHIPKNKNILFFVQEKIQCLNSSCNISFTVKSNNPFHPSISFSCLADTQTSFMQLCLKKKRERETPLAIFTLLSEYLSNRVLTYSLEMHAEVMG